MLVTTVPRHSTTKRAPGGAIVQHKSRHTTAWTFLSQWTVALFLALPIVADADEIPPPNILWLSAEDISPHLGCYGDPHAITPHLDQLATEGIRYTHAFTTAGVCSPCRSGIITGMYQTTLGTHHMRCTAVLPEFIKPFPVYLRRAGYFCTNRSKTDYQFKHPSDTWDASRGKKAHWRHRPKKDQPFFAVFNFTGCHESGIAGPAKYRSVTSKLTPAQRQDAAALSTLPPYYPDTRVVREDWKRNYELITAMDAWAGDLIGQLKADGLYENTIIFFWSDHGVGLPRAKRWLYDSGTHIPLIVRIPEKYRGSAGPAPSQGRPGTVTDQLVSSIDFGPTVLKLAGVSVPDHVQGEPFLGRDLGRPRRYVFGARDRMDERYDIIRMVRNKRYKYIRNYEPLKTFYQYMNTPEKGATMTELRRLHDAGKLSPEADRLFSNRKPVEELYDCQADPHELNNLAGDKQYHCTLGGMRAVHRKWVRDTGDLGVIPEGIITERTRKLGNSYAILRQGDTRQANLRLFGMAARASSGHKEFGALVEGFSASDAAVRYWAATGVGNVGASKSRSVSGPLKIKAREAATRGLKDSSATVRIASARALCHLDRPKNALPVLIKELTTGNQWERLQAAIVLDEIDEQARPVLEQMRVGLTYQEGFNSNGKYRVRVMNRALNELEGTNRTVP